MSRSPENIAVDPAVLRHVRRLTGLGVTKLAAEVGVTPSYISNLEAGRKRAVSPAVFAELNRALRIEDVRVLMAQPDEPATTLYGATIAELATAGDARP